MVITRLAVTHVQVDVIVDEVVGSDCGVGSLVDGEAGGPLIRVTGAGEVVV